MLKVAVLLTFKTNSISSSLLDRMQAGVPDMNPSAAQLARRLTACYNAFLDIYGIRPGEVAGEMVMYRKFLGDYTDETVVSVGSQCCRLAKVLDGRLGDVGEIHDHARRDLKDVEFRVDRFMFYHGWYIPYPHRGAKGFYVDLGPIYDAYGAIEAERYRQRIEEFCNSGMHRQIRHKIWALVKILPIATELFSSPQVFRSECRDKLSQLIARMWHVFVDAGTRPVHINNENDFANGLYMLHNFFETYEFVEVLGTRLKPDQARAMVQKMLR